MASIVDSGDFNGEDVATALRDSMSGIGTKEEALADVLASYSNEQLQIARTEFSTLCGDDLLDKIKSELGGNFQYCCVALAQERWEFLAELVHDALKGLGTSEQILVDVLGTIEPADVDMLKAKYQEVYEMDMSEDVEADLGGYFKRFAIAIMNGERTCDGEDEEDDDHNAAVDAQTLYDASEGMGTDECAFMPVFMKRSWSRIREVVAEYQNLVEGGEDGEDNKGLLNVIAREFGGNEEKLLTTIVKFAMDPVDYYAEVLHDCMDGIGTSEWRLIYTIVRRAEVDLCDVAAKYEEKFEESLAGRIENEVSGDLKYLLVKLVNGNA